MNRINTQHFSKLNSLPEYANIIIVGGGLAGLELAKELDQLGATGVLVLDAGPADDLSHINSIKDADAAINSWVDPSADKYFWRPWASKSVPHFADLSGLKRRLGGRSLCWHGVTLPIEHWALCEPWWPKDVIADLTVSWRGGPSLYEQVSADLERWCGNRTSSSDMLSLMIGRQEFCKTPQAIRSIASNNGKLWEAYSPVSYWSSNEGNKTLRQSDSTRILSEVEVVDLVVDKNCVNGVNVRPWAGDVSKKIKCNAVVLTAGTIENTRFAIQALSMVGALNDAKLNGLVDHIVQGFVVTLDPASLPKDIANLGISEKFYYGHCSDHSRSNIFLRLSNNQAGAFVVDVWTMGEQLPSAQGTVQGVHVKDNRWEVFVQSSLTTNDWNVINAQRDELQSFWTAFCNRINHPSSTLEFSNFDAPVRTLADVLPSLESTPPGSGPTIWSGPLGSEYHEGCTLPLGKLLNASHEFVHIKNLFAGGPSTFPRLGAANPSLTNLALARRLAAFLPN